MATGGTLSRIAHTQQGSVRTFMNRKAKRLLAGRLAQSLLEFSPDRSGEFLCPTCLECIALGDVDRISVAHIVPRAANGRLTSLLCKRCNSDFGRWQDKWFGEHARLVRENRSLFQTDHQRGSFEINGIRFGGRYEDTPSGGIKLIIYDHMTSPASLEALRTIRSQPKISVSIPIPLLANEELIPVGFLTAAYLLWFRQLGYSWVCQPHLDAVREQIRNPTRDVLPKNFSARVKGHPGGAPWLAMGYVAGQLALLTGLVDRVVFFPPFDRPDFYSKVPRDLGGVLTVCNLTRPHADHSSQPPAAVFFGDRILVAPGAFFRYPHPALFFSPDGGASQTMCPILPETYERARRLPNAVLYVIAGKRQALYFADWTTAETLSRGA